MAPRIDDLYAKAKEMSANVEDNYLDLAHTLRQLFDRDADKFTDLWQNTDLGRRKAYYMVEIARAYEPLPIPRSRLKKLGWTKAQLLARHVNADNWQELFELAEGNTTKQLEKAMKGERPIKNAHCVVMYFTPKQYAVLEDALLANGGERSGRGILHKEQAIMRLIEQAANGGSGHAS